MEVEYTCMLNVHGDERERGGEREGEGGESWFQVAALAKKI